MIGVLYRIETLKMVKRLATWVAYLCCAVLVIFLYGTYYYNGWKYEGSYYGFPDAWPNILTDGAPIVSIFCAALIALLVASEFDWRTSRQNIIDGLSRGQWFTAKLLLLPTVALVFYGSQLLFAGVLAWIGTDGDIEHAFRLTSVEMMAAAGVFLGVLCYAGIALLIAVTVRSAGPALGITLLYQVFETITTRTLRGFELEQLADCFPFQVHMALFRYPQYLPADSALRLKLDIAWDTTTLYCAGLAWTGVFLAASWLQYRRRDL